MLLAELFQRLPEDYGSLPIPNFPSFDPRYSKIVGQFDGYDVWGSREIPNRDTFGIRDKANETIALCGIDSYPTNGAHVLKELWTSPAYRGKGFATMLVLFLLRKVNVRILLAHNEILSDDARTVILKGLRSFKFKAFTTKGERLDILDVQKMFAQLGTTSDEIILYEDHLKFELFSDSRGNGDRACWHFVQGMNQDLD